MARASKSKTLLPKANSVARGQESLFNEPDLSLQTSSEPAKKVAIEANAANGDKNNTDESNQNIYTVAQISGLVQDSLETNFASIKVKGEICSFTRHSSGHCYFSLKDETAFISVILWKMTAARLKIPLEDGLEVVVSGKVSSYPKSSKYSIIASGVSIGGRGAMLKMLEDRRKKLGALGYFDQSIKKPVPKYPQVIGIITSPTGAVIEDMLNRINARFAGVKIILYPALMQGPLSSSSVIDGLEYFDTLCKTNSSNKPSLVIVARGGGSFEDLFTFNDEALVVKAANFAAKSCALISAIGHGTDFTLLDLAASIHAVTPTAAAELASPDGKAIRQNLKNQQDFISLTISKKLINANQQLDYTFKMLYKPQQARLGALEFKVKSLQQSIASITDTRLKNADFAIKNIKVSTGQINRLNIKLLSITNILCYKTDSLLQNASARLKAAMEQSLGHLIQKIIDGKMLKLNYTSGRAEGLYAGITKSIITDEISGSLISSVKQLTKSQQINITMADGKVKAMIL